MTTPPALQLARQGFAILPLGDANLNTRLYDGFMQRRDDSDVRKTHLFNGRYENIYLTDQHVPALAELSARVREQAADILQHRRFYLGCWFNYMPPQAVTTRHNHDDGFELLSAVYYVRVPENSGELILHGDSAQRIRPEEGRLVFFSPALDHEVTRNNSDQGRLSIAFNIIENDAHQ